MIVLAIAGLIMAIIFLAVPALQRNTHNNSRRSDAAHLAGLVNEYAANKAGALPTAWGTGANQLDVTGESWALVAPPQNTAINTTATAGYGSVTTVVINNGWKCNNGALSGYVSGSRSFSIGYTVETSSATATTCIQG